MSRGKLITGYECFALTVALVSFIALLLLFLMVKSQLGRKLMLQAGHGFCKGFQYCLYSVVKTLVLDIRKVVVVLLEYTEQVIIENRNGNLCIGFLLDKRNNAHTIVKRNVLCRYTRII